MRGAWSPRWAAVPSVAVGRKYGGVLRGATLAAAFAAVTAPAPPAPAEAGGRVHRVTIERFAFRPATIEIRPGDTVEWVNRDTAPHTATSRPRAWDSGGLAKGRSYRRTFRAPGAVDYFCVYHPHMRGRVVVTGR